MNGRMDGKKERMDGKKERMDGKKRKEDNIGLDFERHVIKCF